MRITPPQELDVLAIAPHPDDVEMCCGGTIAQLVAQGHRVAILDLTRGELASNGSPEEREVEARRAADLLGLVERYNLELPDGFIAHALSSESPESGGQGAIARLVSLIRELRPALIFAPSTAARHPDHVATAHLVDRAVFFAGVKRYPALNQAPAFRPRRLIRYLMRVGLRPSFVVDVSAVYHIKRQAISCYQSQLNRAPHQVATLANAPESHRSLEARDQVFGALIGVQYAEGFLLDEAIQIHDPVKHFAEARPATLFQDERTP